MLRRVLIPAAAAALALGLAPPAFGSTARVETVDAGQTGTALRLIYEADAGEHNDVLVSVDPDGWYRVHDPGANAIVAGARCEAAGADVRCFANEAEIRTGDMDDVVRSAAGSAIARVSGGDGDDRLELGAENRFTQPSLMGGDGNDILSSADPHGALLDGGAGNDRITGSSGPDTLDPGPGSDDVTGGDGPDTLTNASRTDGVTVDLGQHFAAAAGGERDTLAGDIENLVGSTGPDALTGDAGKNEIGGGAGDDVVHGGGGDDTLTGDAGTDEVSGDSGNDTLFGGSDYLGDDSPNTLSGGSGRDLLVGGGRADVLDGGPSSDWLFGHGGRDVFQARDGEFDWVTCGSHNRSRVLLDDHDFVKRCGRVDRDRSAHGVFVYGVLKPARYVLGLGCPEDATRGCGGTYRLTFRGGHTRAVRWSLKTGQSADRYYFPTKLTPRERRAVAAASRLTLRLVTRDTRGRRVTATYPFPGPPITGWPQYAAGVDCDGCPPDP